MLSMLRFMQIKYPAAPASSIVVVVVVTNGKRCSWVLKTQQQTLCNGSIQKICLPSKTMIYLW